MVLRFLLLAVAVGMVGVGLGACGSSSGYDQGDACVAAVNNGGDNAKAFCTEAADLGDSYGMYGLGRLAYDAGDLVLAKSWYQKSADLGNLDAIAALEHLRRSN